MNTNTHEHEQIPEHVQKRTVFRYEHVHRVEPNNEQRTAFTANPAENCHSTGIENNRPCFTSKLTKEDKNDSTPAIYSAADVRREPADVVRELSDMVRELSEAFRELSEGFRPSECFRELSDDVMDMQVWHPLRSFISG